MNLPPQPFQAAGPSAESRRREQSAHCSHRQLAKRCFPSPHTTAAAARRSRARAARRSRRRAPAPETRPCRLAGRGAGRHGAHHSQLETRGPCGAPRRRPGGGKRCISERAALPHLFKMFAQPLKVSAHCRPDKHGPALHRTKTALYGAPRPGPAPRLGVYGTGTGMAGRGRATAQKAGSQRRRGPAAARHSGLARPRGALHTSDKGARGSLRRARSSSGLTTC